VRLALYASGGATSDGLARWQAPAAARELAALRAGARPGLRPGPVTLTIGGNDLLRLQAQAFLTGHPTDQAAVLAAVAEVERNLETTLATLIDAGGPASRITVTAYYDPFAGLPPSNPTRELAAVGTTALNQAIARAAARHPAQVRVAAVDRTLPADATIRDYLADQIHPNDRGHAAIAAAVAQAWAVGSRQ
jgi:lysophospholipase L1-like esterase